MKADLHMHSTHSDGRLTTRELVDLAAERGVDVISITDHDTVGDVEDTIAYAQQRNIRFIPGVELSTLEDGRSVHVLGYFTDRSYQSESLLRYFRDIRQKREHRARRMIELLDTHFDIKISYDAVAGHARGIIARPHIAKAIVDAYPEYDHDDVFERFIGNDCKAYVPSVELPVQDGIDLLRRHNCLVVLAHPTLLKDTIHDKVLAYAFDGIEARYVRNQDNHEHYYRTIAAERGWIVTGGSDFHGIQGDTKHAELGQLTIDGEDLKAFLTALQK